MMFPETFYIKPIFGTAVIGLMCLCTSTVHQQAAHQKPTPNTPSSQVKTTTPLQSSLPLTESDSSIPLYLPPSQWQGENFIVLPKQKLVRSLGYQLCEI